MSNNYKKIKNRSDAYQDKILELAMPHELLDIFTDGDSLYKRLNPFAYNDEIEELNDQLKVELWRIINDNLTERQKEVIRLCASGKTQIEVAKILNVNQSSIVKVISGNKKYSELDNNGRPTTYGGVKLKLQKVVKEDKIVNAILQRIADIRDSEFI